MNLYNTCTMSKTINNSNQQNVGGLGHRPQLAEVYWAPKKRKVQLCMGQGFQLAIPFKTLIAIYPMVSKKLNGQCYVPCAIVQTFQNLWSYIPTLKNFSYHNQKKKTNIYTTSPVYEIDKKYPLINYMTDSNVNL